MKAILVLHLAWSFSMPHPITGETYWWTFGRYLLDTGHKIGMSVTAV